MMIRVLKKIITVSIKKIVMLFCLPFLLVTALSSVLYYRAATDEFSCMLTENAANVLQNTRVSMDNALNHLFIQVNSLTQSHYFYIMRNNIAEDRTPISPPNYLTLANSFTNFLQQNANSLDFIQLFINDKNIHYYRSSSGNFNDNTVFNISDYENRFYPNSLIWNTDTDDPCFSSIGLVETLGSSDTAKNGFFYVALNDSFFVDMIKNVRLTSSSHLYITSGSKIIFSDSTESSDAAQLLTQDDYSVLQEITGSDMDGSPLYFSLSSYHAIYIPLDLEPMGILALIPGNDLHLSYQNFSDSMMLLTFVVLIICLILYYVISIAISRPVIQLKQNVEKIQITDSDALLPVSGSIEIRVIANSINEMLIRIRDLIHNLEDEMKATRDAELRALYSQINPHFLYNTLDSIMQLYDMEENEKASKMVKDLSEFYRIGVSKGSFYITLGEEIKHTECYLSILQNRFEDFNYLIDIPDTYSTLTVPKLILQPLVENSLIHGLRPYRKDGCITIKAFSSNSAVYLTVEDNGCGMEDAYISKLYHEMDSPATDSKKTDTYGLKNVNDRLKLFYGSKFRLIIHSQPDKGTKIIIPLKEVLPNDENTFCR